MDLFAGMDVKKDATPPATQQPPQQQQATEQPQPAGSGMPGLFAGLSLGGPAPTTTAPPQQQQQPQAAKSLGSAFGIQLGALSQPAPPVENQEASKPPEPAQGNNTLSLFQGMMTQAPPAEPPKATAPAPNSMFSGLNLSGSAPTPSEPKPAESANTSTGYAGPSFDDAPPVTQSQTSTVSSFGFMTQTAAPQTNPQPQQQKPQPEEDPFEEQFGKRQDLTPPQTQASPEKAQTPAKSTQNESFEEIKVNTTAGSAKSGDTSKDKDQMPTFMINNKPVSSINEVIQAQQKHKPQSKGFLKSAFNFMTGGMLGTTAAEKKAYAPQIPQAATQKKPETASNTKEIGGVTIVTGAQGTGISESDAPIKDDEPSPIGNNHSMSNDPEKASDLSKIPPAQTSSFNFIGMSTSPAQAQESATSTAVPQQTPSDPPKPEEKQPEPATSASNAFDGLFSMSSMQATEAPQTEVQQPPTQQHENTSIFNFMNSSLPAQQTEPVTTEPPTKVWGPVGSSDNVQQSSNEPQVAQSSNNGGGAANDLFNMLNQSLSQSTTQTNQPGGNSAFNFIQNQSLSMSAKSDQAYPPPVTQAAQAAKQSSTDYEEFEDLSESREIIEDRIFRLKLQIIDLTITQQELSTQQETLDSDVKILSEQKDATTKQEEQAAEKEDYEEAQKLTLKIQSIKQLISAKQAQHKKLDEDVTSLESRKGDKYQELNQLVEKSQSRLNEIRTTQQEEMNSYEETEQLAVDEKKKRLHYERIRISEDSEDMRRQKEQIEKIEAEIDEQVYEDTKDQHIEKHRLDNEVEQIDQEIVALEQQLALKQKAKETLILERGVYEKQIDLARSKYSTKINKQASLKEKLKRKEEKLEQDKEDQSREIELLSEYEEHFKAKMTQFEQELDDIAQLESYLQSTNQRISTTLSEKKACHEAQFNLKQERHGFQIKLLNMQDTMEHRREQIQLVETQIEDTNNQLSSIEQRKLKVEAEKKKFAAQRKFKEASTCQGQLKSLQSESENYEKFKADYEQKKASLEEEADTKVEEMSLLESKIAELTVEIERQQQKFLIYRIYDCNDMIKVLRPFNNEKEKPVSLLMKNAMSKKEAKDKQHHLEQELIKMQKELLELELKYGPYEVELPPEESPTVKRADDDDEESKDAAAEDGNLESEQNKNDDAVAKEVPVVEDDQELSPVVSPTKETSIDNQKVSDVEPTTTVAEPVPQMTRAELTAEIKQLEEKLVDLETKIEKACEDDDFELADELQQESDKATETLDARKAALESMGAGDDAEDAPKESENAAAQVEEPMEYQQEEKVMESAAQEGEEEVKEAVTEVTEPAPATSSFSFMTKQPSETQAAATEDKAQEEGEQASKSAPEPDQEVQTTQEDKSQEEMKHQEGEDDESVPPQQVADPEEASKPEATEEKPSSAMPGLFAGLNTHSSAQ